ncbi:LysR family transcriptional regulator substrate-binding protein [Leuconostoc sp. DB-1]|uniref:LysR family transcriptional regulator substrate-binding protein n=1 Tax=Leuconostoc sp. DB-1 TaxID=2724526 RepID=UPI00359C18C6
MKFYTYSCHKKINQTFPSIECRIYEEEPDQSLLGLRSHKFDIVLTGYFEKKVTFPNSDIISTNIGEDKLLVVSSKDDKSIFPIKHFSDLASKKWIIEPKNTYLSNHIIQMCRENLFDPDVVSEIHSYDAIKSLVKSQLGISILPSLALTAGTDMNGIFIHDFDIKSKRQIYLLERKPQKRIPAIKIVSQMITDQATAVLKNFN